MLFNKNAKVNNNIRKEEPIRPRIQKTAFCIIVPIDQDTGEVRIGNETDLHVGQVAYLMSVSRDIIRTSMVTGIRRDASNLIICTCNSEYRLVCDRANILG